MMPAGLGSRPSISLYIQRFIWLICHCGRGKLRLPHHISDLGAANAATEQANVKAASTNSSKAVEPLWLGWALDNTPPY